jgi:hypothetical protein
MYGCDELRIVVRPDWYTLVVLSSIFPPYPVLGDGSLRNLTALTPARSRHGQEPSSIRSKETLRPRELRNDGDGNALRNRILLGLPGKEYDAIFSKLTLVDLELHDLLQEAGDLIEFCYFPNTMMGSVLNVMADGKSVEVGLAGWEGFIGLPTIAVLRSSASRVVTQAMGAAYRISASDMRKAKGCV